MLHDPQNQCPMSGMHRCGESCADFYPLQICSNICGIVVIVVAAIACYNVNYEFFQHISTTHGNTTTFPPVFLQTQTRFGKYLRLVVASWIACDSINVEYVIAQFWKQQQGQLPSSCSTTFTVPAHNTDNIECNNSYCEGENPQNISEHPLNTVVMMVTKPVRKIIIAHRQLQSPMTTTTKALLQQMICTTTIYSYLKKKNTSNVPIVIQCLQGNSR